MTTKMVNFKWPQGEDIAINLIYKEGSTAARAAVVNLATGYSLRMDLVTPSTKELVYSFTSDETPGVLTSGANKSPNINIVLPRGLTLPGGAIYTRLSGPSPITTFNFDIFLRNVASNRQVRILRGSITIDGSYTLWA